MLCNDIMKSNVECLPATDSVQSAARRMRDRNIGFIPVCDSSMKVIGTITDRDLAIRVLTDSRSASTPLADVMTREVVACRATDPVERAQELMAKHQKSRIVCTDKDGKPLGVISLSDIVNRVDPPGAVQTMRRVTAREAHA